MKKTDLCRNARIGFCYSGCRELKRIISFVLCMAFVVVLSSCNEETTSILTEKFVLDCFDEESDESINNAIEGIITQLLSYGFVNPIVFPFSASILILSCVSI